MHLMNIILLFNWKPFPLTLGGGGKISDHIKQVWSLYIGLSFTMI